jgi:hypothetical protein
LFPPNLLPQITLDLQVQVMRVVAQYKKMAAGRVLESLRLRATGEQCDVALARSDSVEERQSDDSHRMESAANSKEDREASAPNGVPEWATNLDTPSGRKAAREGWKKFWSIPTRECTNEDLAEVALSTDDVPFLNQWENGKTRLKNPAGSERVLSIERTLRRNIAPKWHPAAKQTPKQRLVTLFGYSRTIIRINLVEAKGGQHEPSTTLPTIRV